MDAASSQSEAAGGPAQGSPTPCARELAVARRLAREAGAIVVGIRDGGALGVEHKAGNEPVTIADRAASELIVAGLEAAFPADVVISEERPFDPALARAERVWFVDPIDGTKDFIRGAEGFAVMIGLAVGGRPALGVVYQPTQGGTFWAAPGLGAWFALGDGPPRRLRVRAVRDVGALRLVASASHRTAAIDEVKSALGIADERNVGSVGIKIALIALGERDLYVNPTPKCKAWDTCAPEAIIVAAGGLLTDGRGAALPYTRADLGGPRGLVACGADIHAAVIAKLAELPLFRG
ncbi:MAG TPA: 3'(2'),5'-bisphosphate nucleotidase CysQ [Kofleriaceae bacterium]|nr:3'(2'),5'-bisphosphate nucleotidase CysQ [Kofleriaceae bacterium]